MHRAHSSVLGLLWSLRLGNRLPMDRLIFPIHNPSIFSYRNGYPIQLPGRCIPTAVDLCELWLDSSEIEVLKTKLLNKPINLTVFVVLNKNIMKQHDQF